MFFDTLATSVPLHRGGKLKILAVADLQRAKSAPELPTFSEAGLPGFRSITWFGLVAPPKTPAALVQRINARHRRNPAQPRRSASGCRACRSRSARTSSADTAKFFADETALWGKVDQGRRHRAAVGDRARIPLFAISKLCAKSSGGFGPHM